MNSSSDHRCEELRHQRNIAIVGAALVVIVSLGLAVPGYIAWQRRIVSVNMAIGNLQAEIDFYQRATRAAESKIVRSQTELRELIAHGRR